jgi:hypothetical protein
MKFPWLSMLFLLCACLFNNASQAQTADIALGQTLEKNLFNTVAQKKWLLLEDMIAPSFQSIHADKIRNREEVVNYIKSLSFKDYAFHDLHTTQPDDKTLIVTYEMTFSAKVGQTPESGKRIKNLSVWKKFNNEWKWIAHAVID